MKRKGTSELLREGRPQGPRWATSARGRAVLTGILGSAAEAQSDQPNDDANPRRTSRKRIGVAVIAVAALATAALLIAPRLLHQQSFEPADIGTIDVHVKGDAEFYAPMSFKGGAALEVHHFETVKDGAKASTAVVVAQVVDVKKTHKVRDLYTFGITIQVVEVLSGTLPGKDRSRLTVEFLAGSTDPADRIAQMNKNLPKGLAVWFLISNAEEGKQLRAKQTSQGQPISKEQEALMAADAPYYRLSSSQGLYLQGEDHVINPIAADNSSGMVAELETKAKLSELAEGVRALR
jgi:hypothetical protein